MELKGKVEAITDKQGGGIKIAGKWYNAHPSLADRVMELKKGQNVKIVLIDDFIRGLVVNKNNKRDNQTWGMCFNNAVQLYIALPGLRIPGGVEQMAVHLCKIADKLYDEVRRDGTDA